VGSSIRHRRLCYWLIVASIAVAGLIFQLAGWRVWAHREQWFGSASKLGLIEATTISCESVAIGCWVVFSARMDRAARVVGAIASIAGLVAGVGGIVTETPLAAPHFYTWTYASMVALPIWPLGSVVFLYLVLRAVARRKSETPE
jgi:hypothetical protein